MTDGPLDELEWWATLPSRSDPKWAMCWSLSDKLAVCAVTIASLAERVAAQHQLLAARAEKPVNHVSIG